MASRSYSRSWCERDVREGRVPGKKRQLRATPGRDRAESQRLDWKSILTHQHLRADLSVVETPPSALRPAHVMDWIKAGRGGSLTTTHTSTLRIFLARISKGRGWPPGAIILFLDSAGGGSKWTNFDCSIPNTRVIVRCEAALVI